MQDFTENDPFTVGRMYAKVSFTGLHAGEIDALAAEVKGEIVCPGDAGYDGARAVWNGRVDRRPALVVYATDAADVAAAVAFARENDLPLAVRGAGHHPAGYGTVDDGLVLDLSRMKGLTVDADSQTVRAEPGLTAGEFLHGIHSRGFIVTVGSHPTVGITGLTLGGGIGLLMSRYGLACDNLLEAQVVTADGRTVTASAGENPDLFWALRGGGGSYGVVTSMKYRVHPVEPTLAGAVFHPAERASEALRFFRQFAESAPDNLGLLAALMTTPEGHRVCALMACHTGPIEEGERTLAPLRAFGPPVMDMFQPMPYTAVLDFFQDADPAGARYAYSTHCLPALTDEAIDAIASYGAAPSSPHTAVVLYHLHGAVSRVPADATAFALRETPFLLGVYTGWMEGADAPHLEWQQRLRSAIAPFSDGAGYLNLHGDADVAALRATCGENHERLQQVKRTWDPENLFEHNTHNVPRGTEDPTF